MKKTSSNLLNYIAVLAICCFAGAGNYMNAAMNTFQQAFPSIDQSTIMTVFTLVVNVTPKVNRAAAETDSRH